MTGRILMLVTKNQRRGAEAFAHTLARELADRELAVRLVALAAGASTPALPVDVLGPSPLAPVTLARLRQAMGRADLVVACGSRTLPASVIAGVATRRPIIYQNIGDPLYWAGSLTRRLRVRAWLRRTHAVVALSDQSKSVLASRFGVPRTRIRVIPNARSATAFRPATAEEKRHARARLGLPGDVPVLAVVGALSAEKRVDVAISAAARIRRDVRLLVVGDGALRSTLQRQAAREAPGRVSFTGQTGDPVAALHASDVVLLTSASEGMPGVLIEAGLCGLPAVSTEVGYVRDIVIPGLTGELASTGDPDAVAKAVETVLDDVARRGREARAHCTTRFDLARVSDDWAALIRAVLS